MTVHIDVEPHPQGMVDLASNQAGGEVLWCSDEFFAEASNLLKPEPAIFDSERYTERGKWMDGWESRRRRTPGHDTAIIALGIVGQAALININTAHFTGNYPAFARVWACDAPEADLNALRTEVQWSELVPSTALRGGSTNLVTPVGHKRITHLKLDIFPAGGVARLRVFGHADLTQPASGHLNLISNEVGGRAIACSDMYFSEMHNLLKTSAPRDMGDGWETKRVDPPEMIGSLFNCQNGIPSHLEVIRRSLRATTLIHFRSIAYYGRTQSRGNYSPCRFGQRPSRIRNSTRPGPSLRLVTNNPFLIFGYAFIPMAVLQDYG